MAPESASVHKHLVYSNGYFLTSQNKTEREMLLSEISMVLLSVGYKLFYIFDIANNMAAI